MTSKSRVIHTPGLRRDAGFTMVELVTTMSIMAVLAVSAMPVIGAIRMAREADWRARLDTTLRLAHSVAYSHRRLVCASTTATGVSLAIATSRSVSTCMSPLSTGTPRAASIATTLPTGFATLYFQPSGSITLDAAGLTPANGSITFDSSAPITIVGALGLVR